MLLFSEPLKILGFKSIYNNYSLVFEIPTEKKGSVFMKINTGCKNNQRFIVILNPRKFDNPLDSKVYFELDDPLNNPEYQVSYIKPKIEQCIKGFSCGIENPVTLSQVSFCKRKFAFTDGTTRFSWLIAVGACSIPVECDEESAYELFKKYGDERFSPQSLQYYVDKYNNIGSEKRWVKNTQER